MVRLTNAFYLEYFANSLMDYYVVYLQESPVHSNRKFVVTSTSSNSSLPTEKIILNESFKPIANIIDFVAFEIPTMIILKFMQ